MKPAKFLDPNPSMHSLVFVFKMGALFRVGELSKASYQPSANYKIMNDLGAKDLLYILLLYS